MKKDENKRIVLPEKLQINMMNFFLRTSIPRSAEKKNLLSNQKDDRREE
ncbi:MAG: hypothetical protein LBS36_01185 [Oscillospiraceae bacterium]|jgi:hypothetical protein|nr:hypothetical protein [Oscillospiraceae bacterium]